MLGKWCVVFPRPEVDKCWSRSFWQLWADRLITHPQEDIILVHQNANERALYLQWAQENTDFEGSGAGSLAHMEKLLKLCSHFHDGSQHGSAASAEDQCTKELESGLSKQEF